MRPTHKRSERSPTVFCKQQQAYAHVTALGDCSECSDWHHLAAMGPAEILSAVEDHETIYSSLDKPLGHKRFEGF